MAKSINFQGRNWKNFLNHIKRSDPAVPSETAAYIERLQEQIDDLKMELADHDKLLEKAKTTVRQIPDDDDLK